jgi:hypothetical protein
VYQQALVRALHTKGLRDVGGDCDTCPRSRPFQEGRKGKRKEGRKRKGKRGREGGRRGRADERKGRNKGRGRENGGEVSVKGVGAKEGK